MLSSFVTQNELLTFKRLKDYVFFGDPDPLCAPTHERKDAFEECRDTLLSRIRAWIRKQNSLPYLPQKDQLRDLRLRTKVLLLY